jgi:two-component system nitrate/nitrite response regulator NarL
MQEFEGYAVLLVDDHPLFREGLALALRQSAPALAVHAVASLAEALHILDRDPDRFDLAVLDYRLPGEDGLMGAGRLRARFPGMACALMSGADDSSLPDRARHAGLMAYFPKSLEVDGLIEGLRCLARGETYFSAPSVLSVRNSQSLTVRQQEIVQLAARGASNKEIAQALGIAPHTVKNHLAQIFEKLGASNRAQAVSMAYEHKNV